MLQIIHAESAEDIDQVRQLFLEYAEGVEADICFQEFDRELAGLPGSYGPPRGRLLLARENGRPCGCVGLRPQTDEACEMKRLYVRSSARSRGLGRRLVLQLLREAASLGYARMLLDTLPSMEAARALYASLGFATVPPAGEAAEDGRIFMEILLPRPAGRQESRPDE